DTAQPVWQGNPPQHYTFVLGELEQTVDHETVHLKGLQRSLDESAHSRLWQNWSTLRSSRWRDDVDTHDLSAFAIDGQRRLSAESVDLRWGQRDDHTYIYDGISNRLHILHRRAYESIQRSVGRLDQQAVLHRVQPVQMLEVDDQKLIWDHEQEQWLDHDAPHRPPFGPRVEDLLMAFRRLRVAHLEPHDHTLTPLHRLRIHFSDGQEQVIHIGSDDSDQWWIHGDAVPPQRLVPQNRAALRERLAAFAQDPIVHIPLAGSDPTIRRVEVWRDGTWWFALESDEDPHGDLFYEVLWNEGRDPAATRAMWNFQQALNELSVEDVQRRQGNDSPSEDAQQGQIHIRAWGRRDQLLSDLRLSPGQALTQQYMGSIDQLPAFIQELSPDIFLDRHLLPQGLNPQRIEKFQRVRYQSDQESPQAEVFVRGESGWRATYPDDRSVDHHAVQRLVQGILSAEAERAWLPRDAVPSQPHYSIALRITGAAHEDGRNELALVDTFDRDWGLRIIPREDGDWDAYEVERGFRFQLEQDLVAEWFTTLTQVPILPVLAHQILHLRWQGEESAYALRRTSDNQWRLMVGDDDQAADSAEVRRLLRELVALTADEILPQAAILGEDETRMRLLVGVPSPEQDAHGEQWIISIGPEQGQRTLLSVHREGTRLTTQGRMWVKNAHLAPIMAPAQRYRQINQDGQNHDH
ncbi:MAG: hypothetical protein EA401_08575, partial [Planctomycetota bacterium]